MNQVVPPRPGQPAWTKVHAKIDEGPDGKIYFASEDGDMFVVKAGPAFELLAKNSIGEVLLATPAISGGALIVRGLNHVFAIGEKR